jgi:hypothetical protein
MAVSRMFRDRGAVESDQRGGAHVLCLVPRERAEGPYRSAAAAAESRSLGAK